ncbi:transcriptional regulator [Clostridia bacterium]|nr:transcriptional regulator [Clostridia bacterium]GHV35734.1 transcriptional regulator [Clostridia bacterium]
MTNFDKYLAEQLKNPEFAREYKALEPEYEIIKQIIKSRSEQNLTQRELAERIGIKQSNISRLESGNYNPSLDFLKKVASGLGKEIHIEFREPTAQMSTVPPRSR